ncbi:hypothetical protein VB713_25020 [Anabaena cylindrica UHCC 0172]|uniref:hypothetical protein n=1 Tax=Anabaena cylindrica TaxID=1165 RepID=UPI002B207F86|nr:hypothetical protein [Anabaena cylindrica]MEA5554202.1 hypothetical protein [Anabaena cylindrica UHCC 0172]
MTFALIFIANHIDKIHTLSNETALPGTLATLYFDLLGFGAKDAKITIDNGNY